MNQDVICIAGAHRSGTSMLTRLLHEVGLELGPQGDMMPAQPDNPDGFWENLRFVQLNDEVLNAVGAAWDLPPWQEEIFDQASLQPMRSKAQLLIERFRDKPAWGWKDPRNCLTLPFWQNLLPGLKTIIIVRNPLEAAYSMHKRNGTSYALGLRLWEILAIRIRMSKNIWLGVRLIPKRRPWATRYRLYGAMVLRWPPLWSPMAYPMRSS
jgi:hypothetical protein